MILEAILTPVFSLLGWLVNLMPVLYLPEFIMGAISGLVSVFNTANFFLPMEIIFAIMAGIMAFEMGMITFYVVNWVIHRVPFFG